MRRIEALAAVVALAHFSVTCAGHRSPAGHDSRGGHSKKYHDAHAAQGGRAAAKTSSMSRQRAASIAGCWDLVASGHAVRGKFSLVVERRLLRGVVELHGAEHPISGGAIDENAFRFEIETRDGPVQFEGELSQSELIGTMNRSGQELAWAARRCRMDE